MSVPTKFEHVHCKSLAIVDDTGIERIRLSLDENGGRIDISSNSTTNGAEAIKRIPAFTTE